MNLEDQSTITEIVQLIGVVIIWSGGYLAAPLLFMATLGVFRNLAGIGSGPLKKLSGKLTQPGRERRAWGQSGRKEVRQQKATNKGATRWGTRRKQLHEGYRESSRMLDAKEQLNEDLTTTDPNWRQSRARQGISPKVLDQARAEQNKEDKSVADYALQRAGIDDKLETFSATHNGVEYVGLDKDDAVALASVRAVVKNSRGEVAADGSEASQRAALDLAGRQGIASIMNKVRGEEAFEVRDAQGNTQTIEGISQLQQRAQQSRDPGDIAHLQATSSAFTEAMNTNVGTMMQKMPSYFKGQAKAFGDIEAGSFAKFDPSEAVKMVDWVSDRGNFTDANGTYDQGKHEQAAARISESLRLVSENPEKYNASPKLMQETRNALDNIAIDPNKFPDRLITNQMITAIGNINKESGAIDQ